MLSSLHGRIKDWWHARGRLTHVAAWMNQVAGWCNRFDAAYPLVALKQNGSVYLVMQQDAIPATHPWKATRTSATKLTVAGGSVNLGDEVLAVEGTTETISVGAVKVWLKVTIPNDGEPSAKIDSGADWPEEDYEVDSLPGDPACTPPSLDGWCKVYIRLAEVDDNVLTQLAHSDILLPRGQTIELTRVLAHYWDDVTLKLVVLTETLINGIVRDVSGPTCVSVFATGPCPAPAEE